MQAHTSLANGTEKQTEWNTINWRKANRTVRNLRHRIFRATQEGNLNKVRSLQKLMLKSYSNRLVSVRRVTQINAGKNTPGVDKLVIKTPAARGRMVDALAHYSLWKAKPARRVYIPKASGNKLRPLGMPVWSAKLVQEVIRMILNAYYDPQFSSHSHGFRPERGCHTAFREIDQNWSATTWFIEGDIRTCFDHDTFLKRRLLSLMVHDTFSSCIHSFPLRHHIPSIHSLQAVRLGETIEGHDFSRLNTVETPETVSRLDSNLSDTPDTPDTPETLDILIEKRTARRLADQHT